MLTRTTQYIWKEENDIKVIASGAVPAPDFQLTSISQVSELPQESTLLVSSFAPARCGIGRYATEQFEQMKAKGIKILRATMLENSDADYHFSFLTLSGLLHWWKFCHKMKFRSITVHYADNYFFPRPVYPHWATIACRFVQMDAMRCLAHSTKKDSRLIIHEISLSKDLPSWARWVRLQAFSCFNRIEFHTRHLADDFLKFFPSIPNSEIHVVEHTRFMGPKYHGTRNDARLELKLPVNKSVFLCIGLINLQKGFDAAIEAFAISLPDSAELHIVGTPSQNDDLAVAHADFLQASADRIPNVHFHRTFTSDVDFDKWLCAATVVILPYRSIASSGVGARASLFNTQLIISDIPNLKEQFSRAIVFSNTKELAVLIGKISAQSD